MPRGIKKIQTPVGEVTSPAPTLPSLPPRPHLLPGREDFVHTDAWEHPGEPGLRVPDTTTLTNLLALVATWAAPEGVRRFIHAALQLQHEHEIAQKNEPLKAPRRDES